MSESNNDTNANNGRPRSSAREQARAMQAKQGNQDKKKGLMLRISMVAVSLVVVAALAIFVSLREPAEEVDFTTGTAPAVANEAGGVVLTSPTETETYDDFTDVDSENLPSHGDHTNGIYRSGERIVDDRPHVIIYTDPACPHCASFEETHHLFLEDMLDNGEITLEYRSVAFMDASSSGYSSSGANAFLCMADEHPENYFDFVGNITASGSSPSGSELTEFAEENYGVNIENCLRENEQRALVNYNTNLASASGITGTPTVLVDGVDWQDHGGSFVELLDEALEGSLDSPATS